MAPIHDRMPVILSSNAQSQWMNNKEHDSNKLIPCLTPYEGSDLICYPVTQETNKTSYQSPQSLTPFTDKSAPLGHN